MMLQMGLTKVVQGEELDRSLRLQGDETGGDIQDVHTNRKSSELATRRENRRQKLTAR